MTDGVAGRRRPGGDVGGERGQLSLGPRGERLARPRVKLAFGQAALHERGLEHVDHVLAVGVGRTPMAAGRRCSLFRSCDHRCLPGSTTQGKRSGCSPEGHPKVPHDDGSVGGRAAEFSG